MIELFIIPFLYLGFQSNPNYNVQSAPGLQLDSGNVQVLQPIQLQDNTLDLQSAIDSGGITVYGESSYGDSPYGI